VGSTIFFISARVTFQPFKVIDFGANGKGICDLLLVCHSNLGPILHRFGDIARFCAPDPTSFWGVPVGPDHRCWGQCEQVP